MSPSLDLTRLAPGFRDPVRDSQIAFRRIMEAMSRPGTLVTLPCALSAPAGIGPAAGAVLLALADIDTPVWLDPTLASGGLASWLRFHCSCALTCQAAEAAFALAVVGAKIPPLSAFNLGDAKYPDRATTLLLVLPSLIGGSPVRLMGPGILGETRLAPAQLTDDFWAERSRVNATFQFGIDLLLCAGDSLIGLPRTTRTLGLGS